MVGELTTAVLALLVLAQEGRQVQLLDRVTDEVNRMILRQPVAQRRR